MDAADNYELTWLVRRLFRAMGQAADSYLADTGLTAADRAVMEFLSPDLQLTVPAIARRYKVSRQHVQATVNGLLQQGYLEKTGNPQHRRSPLLSLSARGVERFATIRRFEAAVIATWFRDVPDGDVRNANEVLRRLLANIEKETDNATP